MFSTRSIMVAAAIFLAIAGGLCLFVPSELLLMLGLPGDSLIIQVMSALYLGFAAANWTGRGVMIGGIYARPLLLANFVHFVVGAIVLASGISDDRFSMAYVLITLIYLAFAVLFVLLLFGRRRP